MPNYSFLRIAGIAGIVAAASMLAGVMVLDPTTFMPSSPLFTVFLWVGNLAGIVLSVGLYQLYAPESPTLSKVALGLSVLGYIIYTSTLLGPYNPDNPLLKVADILIYVVGVPLFSWLAYSTHKGPRALAIVGFLTGLVGLGLYTLTFGAGVHWTDSTHPLIGALNAFFFAYLLLVLVWLAWTGVSLLRHKPQLAMA